MIATGMDYRDTEVVEIAAAASDLFLFIGVADDRQGNAARTHPDASLVRDHGEVSIVAQLSRQKSKIFIMN